MAVTTVDCSHARLEGQGRTACATCIHVGSRSRLPGDPDEPDRVVDHEADARTVDLHALGARFERGRLAGTFGESEDVALEVKEAFIRLGRLSAGPSVLIGRQRFDDERKWLYEEDLDAVRLRYAQRALTVELSVSRDGLARKDRRAMKHRMRPPLGRCRIDAQNFLITQEAVVKIDSIL